MERNTDQTQRGLSGCHGVMTALWTAAEAKAFQKYGLDGMLTHIRKENR
jgi:hypothetical protein